MPKRKCFVVMGFGEKTDHATGRTLDLDKTYRIIIRKAVEEAGLECIRADDVIHSGLIDKPMYEMLLEADLVIADLSTANPNAIYELGVRHALRPHTTIVIAEKQFRFPFDLTHLVIRPYEHLGRGIDAEEAERVREDLKKAIAKLLEEPDVDSPVFAFLPQLRAWNAGVAPIVAAIEAEHIESDMLESDAAGAQPDETTSALMDLFLQAKAESAWGMAVGILQRIRQRRPNDEYITQQLALATYKSRQPDAHAALLAAHAILQELGPEQSTSPETLGLWSAVHKRLYEETGDPAHLDEAIRALEKGFHIRNDHYNGINLAYLLNVRAMSATPREAQADVVLAERTRRRVIGICQRMLDDGIRDDEGRIDPAETFWVKASLAEALLGSGREQEAAALRAELIANAPQQWMAETMQEQLGKLTTMIAAANQ